jgi:CheY-like chemotaxis protein
MGETSKQVVLYVEDEPAILRLAARRLDARCEFHGATSDVEACAKLETLAARIAVVVMDLGLAGSTLQGLDLIKVIRGTYPQERLPAYARGLRRLDVPIVVVTAAALPEFEEAAHEAGADLMLAKPIDFTRLNLALAQLAIKGVMRRLEGPASAEGPLPTPERLG